MTIGFDFRMGGVGHAGLGRYTKELLLHLLRQNTQDQFVVFYNSSTDKTDIELLQTFTNVELVKVKARHYSVLEQTEFLQVLNKCKLDLMHFTNFNHPIFYRGKFVVTIHDMVHHEMRSHKPTHFLHYFSYKLVMAHAILASSAIITPSQASKDAILKYTPQILKNQKRLEKIYEILHKALAKVYSKVFKRDLVVGFAKNVNLADIENKISVIYEGVSVNPVSENILQTMRDRFLLRRPYFLFVGTLERKKKVPDLAKAFDKFIEDYKMDMDLVVAGKVDSHYPEEREKILAVKNKQRIVLTGFVSDLELSALYQGAYAYATLSPNEGFNLPAVEAMAFGLPIVTVNVPVANEIFDSAALYCEVGDLEDASQKMHLIARDAQFYERQAEASLKRRTFFDWAKTAEETMEVYGQVVSSKL